MKNTKAKIAALLAASLMVSASGCKQEVATMKETLGTTSADKPVVATEKQAETTSETTEASAAEESKAEESSSASDDDSKETSTSEGEAETTQTEQGSTVLDDLRNFKLSDCTDVEMLLNMVRGDAASMFLDMQIKRDGDISYERIGNLDFNYSGASNTGSSAMSSMQLNMENIKTYKTKDEQYISEDGFCSMLEATTDLVIWMFLSMGTSMASEGDTESDAENEVQAKVQAAIDELHNVIQSFADSHSGRYIKVTAEELTAATQGLTFNTSGMMTGFYTDFTGFADAFEPLKDTFCSTNGKYNEFGVYTGNKDLFFDTLIEMDDKTLIDTMSFFLTGNNILNTSVISETFSSEDDTANKAASLREDLKKMKDEVSDDYYYTIRTSTNSKGYTELEIATNYSAYQPTSPDEDVKGLETTTVINITGGMLEESLTLPSDDMVVEFKEWYESFQEATESITQKLSGSDE